MKHLIYTLIVNVVLLTTSTAHGTELRVAVAANFAATLESLAPDFSRTTGHSIRLSSGSSGTLYAQILNGAPFDVFLSADCARPNRLVDQNRTVSGTRFTYAVGKLALWTPTQRHPDAAWLRRPAGRLALANPELAPYGRAAADTLGALGVMNDWRDHLVLGNNVSQAMQFAVSGAVSGAFVSTSQLIAHKVPQGFWWQVPERFHADIRQQAVVLKAASDIDAAGAFLEFLKHPVTRSRIETAGYQTRSYDRLAEVRCRR